jgi:hypothetical protein
MNVKTAFFILIGLSMACGGSPSGPSDPANQFKWTVDGQSFSASAQGMSALDRGNGTVDVGGSICSNSNYAGVSLSFQGPLTVGTYPMSKVSAIYFKTEQWEYRPAFGASPARGSGSVTLSSVSPRVAGTFAFEMVPTLGTGSSGNKSLQGSFDLSFGDGKVCPNL